MPEGPSILIVKEELQQFKGQKVIAVSGNSSIDIDRMNNQTIRSFKSWGKHLLICFDGFTLKIHFLMFGTYRINEKKDTQARLNLTFSNGEINLYTCSLKFLEGDINLYYDWSVDVMNVNWDPEKAKQKLGWIPNTMICDALLDQDIFSGVGNIIKNEVLYRIQVHPESLVGKIPSQQIDMMVDESSIYSFQFLKWKKNYELKSHWEAYAKQICMRCNLPIIRRHTGIKKRRSYFCNNCQKLFK